MQKKIIKPNIHKVSISLNEIRKLTKKYNFVEISIELENITSNPISIYENIANKEDPGFILDFINPGEKTPYVSYLSHEIMEIIDVNDEDPTQKLRNYFDNISIYLSDETRDFSFGAVGYFGYETFKYFEPSVGLLKKDPNNCPEASFMIPQSMISFFHNEQKVIVSTILKLDGKDLEKNYFKATDKLNSLSFLILNNTTFKEEEKIFQNQKTTDFKPNIMINDYISMVKQAKDHILKGELIQCVLSQRFLLEKKFQDINEEFKFNDLKFIKLYSYLVEKNPSDYMYYFNFGNNFQIIGSSPEMFLKVRGNKVIIRPVAGTTSIDKNKDFSEKLFHLKNSEKDNAEHIMLVDLARNDLGRVCKTGSVKVSKLMNIETYSHVAHIVSEIEGIIRPEFDCFDAFIASFPTGTLVGAPKIRAAQLISELEPEGRGPYCGAIGWFDIRGNIDTGTIIRSVIIKDEKISYNGGGGIVFDSDPELEYQETLDKTKIFNEYIE